VLFKYRASRIYRGIQLDHGEIHGMGSDGKKGA
jgi:hypothetical protein